MDVSVIIPVYDDYSGVVGCLECLERQRFEMGRVEVLLVDNGTPLERVPALEARFAGIGLKQLRCEVPGSYSARNAALEVARGELLAFTDADCVPDEGWLAAGIEALEAMGPGGGLVGGPIQVFAQEPEAPTLAERWELARAFPQEHYLRDLHFSATANAFTTRAVVERVGRFSQSLKSGGDREFGERVWAAGLPLVYAPRAIMRHPARRELGELLRKAERTTRGDYQRQQLQQPWSLGRRALEWSRIGLAVGAPGVHALKTLWGTPGGVEHRAKVAAVDTALYVKRRLTMADELWRDR
jgi:glycosyltransferase involved in cell wall biosynthesis